MLKLTPFFRAANRTMLLCALFLFTQPNSILAKTNDTTNAELLDKVISIVNDDVILMSELKDRVEQIKQQLDKKSPPPPDAVLTKQMLDRMILEKIQLQMATSMGIRVNDNELNDSIKGIAQQNEMGPEDFQQMLVDEGIDFGAFREQIRRDLIINQVQKRRIGGRIQVTEQDANTFLSSPLGKEALAADYRLHHILIALPDEADESQKAATLEKAQLLYTELTTDGTLFENIAVAHSDGQNALEGGDLGWRPAAELPTLFADQVSVMTLGQISEPIESPSGYHIIRLTDRRGKTEKIVNQTKVRHILIKPNEIRSNAAAQELINEVRVKILNGESFATLAKTYSDDPGSARNGGDLGWVSPGQMVAEFENVMLELNKNRLSDPFRSRFGWHILEVIDKRDQDVSDNFRIAQAKNYVYKRKFQEELQIWLQEIRQEAFVEMKP